MMQCPYCLSDVDEAAVVCRTCTKDLYLFKPMMAKIASLEAEVKALSASQASSQSINDLAALGVSAINNVKKNGLHLINDVIKFVLVPLALLLIAHALITVVYDLKLIYLRLISILLPWPFGFFLFREQQRELLPWFAATAFLAIASVIGMSAITSLVDHTPILPHTGFELREVLEYSASIAFSFFTGMLLSRFGSNKAPQDKLQNITTNIKAIGGAIATFLTTCVSIYTGLKGVIG